ncbi:MAG: oligosaccharide flippase family protein [Parasphingorhabdus sp.]
MLNRLVHKFRTSNDTLARVGRNSAWLFSSKGVSAVLSLFYLAIVTRTLGPAGFGTFILIVSTGQIIAALFRIQTWQAIVQFGTPLLAKKDHTAFNVIARQGFLIEFVGGIMACVLLYMLLPSAAEQFSLAPEVEQGLLIYGLLVLLAIRSTPTGILRAHDRFRDSAIGEVAVPVTRMIGALTLLAVGPSIVGFLIVWGLSELACAGLLWILVWHNGRSMGERSSAENRLGDVQPAPKASEKSFYGFLAATNFSYLLTIIRERFVVIIVGLFVGAAAAGLFRLADQLANSINRLTEVFARPMFAELSRLYGQSEKSELRSLFLRSLRLSAISGLTMFGILILFGEHILLLMSGPEFVEAYPLLLLLAGATIIGLIVVGLEPLLQAADRATTAFVTRLLSLGFLAALLVWLLPTYGVFGAALAMLMSAIATALLLMLIGWRLLRMLRED